MDISVIIPSLHSWPLIQRTLSSLASQSFTGTYEVIVVDSSGPEAATTIREGFPAVTVIPADRRLLPGEARNLGLHSATGNLIAFVDADAEPAPDWLQQISNLHRAHPEWAGVGGSIANGNADHFYGRIAHLLEFSGYTPSWPARDARVIPTCNLSFKREALPDRPFLEGTWGNEDVELVERLRAEGKVIRFEPSLRVIHYSKTDFGAILAQQRKLGESTGRIRRLYDFPGSWLARTPFAWLLTPIIRKGILLRRALTHEQGAFSLMILGAPWIGCALWVWMLGFRDGARGAART